MSLAVLTCLPSVCPGRAALVLAVAALRGGALSCVPETVVAGTALPRAWREERGHNAGFPGEPQCLGVASPSDMRRHSTPRSAWQGVAMPPSRLPGSPLGA